MKELVTRGKVMSSPDVHNYPSGPRLYEVCVRGVLPDRWCHLLDGMTMSLKEVDGERSTVLRAVVEDQAALAGLLEALFELNATVLSVQTLDSGPRPQTDSPSGASDEAT
jgi:hypothetical protein